MDHVVESYLHDRFLRLWMIMQSSGREKNGGIEHTIVEKMAMIAADITVCQN